MATPKTTRAALLSDKANQKAFDALFEALQKRETLLLVGAGSSVRVGYPTWPGLLKQMEDRIVELQPGLRAQVKALRAQDDALWKASQYRALLGANEYASLMRDLFKERSPTHVPFHERLLALPFRHVLTTNYDPVLEHAHVALSHTPARVVRWNSDADVSELVQKVNDPTLARRYAHLHGSHEDPAEIVLTAEDYDDRYVRTNATTSRLHALLMTQRIVTVGFSLADLDLMERFRWTRAMVEGGEARHFAVLADEKKTAGVDRARLRQRYGIDPVFYAHDKTHSGLDDVIERLHGPVATTTTTVTTATPATKVAAAKKSSTQRSGATKTTTAPTVKAPAPTAPTESAPSKVLRAALTTLYSNTRTIQRLASDAGIAVSRVNFDGAAQDVWFELLTEAERAGSVPALVNVALEEYPRNPALLRWKNGER